LTVPTGDPLSTAGYFERVVHQLEQQAERNRMHARRLSWLETELAILGELPGQSESGQSLLDLLVELLQRCLDGSGLSSGAIFLLNSAGELEQAAELGMTRAAKQRGGVDAATCTVLLGRVEPEGKSLLISSTSSEGRENAELLHRLGAQSVLVTPLHDADQLRGAMVLVSSRDELGEDWAAFASAIGHQMTRVILQAQDRARLEESEERYRHLAESAPIGIFEADLENRYQYVNPCWEQLSGWSLAETLGYGWQRAFRAEDVPALGELGFQATEGHPSSRDLLLVRPDGSECWVSVSISLRRAPNGAPAAFVGTVADISEQNRAEEALHHSEELLRQAQKMEAVGNLAGGIAHDFNNLLTAIIGFGQMGLNDGALSPAVRTYLEEVVRAGERAAILTGQLLAFSRRQVLRPETIDVNVAVADMGRLLSRVIGANVRLDTVLASEAPLVHADPGQIEQVILNLAVNARDAMPGGGHISIETHALEVDEERAAEYGVAPGPYVRIAVTDTGSGIAAEHLAKIFEPFFTTKPKGEGTGMGLATVYGIVKQSAGHIAVYSEVGRGTTFNIYLPRIEGTASAKEPSTPVVEALERGETVLLVEDEVGVRSLAQAVLEGAGYTVLVTEQPDQALALLKTHEGHIHLLLTDVVMPGMSGPDLAARVVESRPDIKVMFMSGYPGDALKLQGGIASDAAYLQKPFRPSGLRQKVREVLDALPT
jgi:PAS domain S-box-containing protein